MGLGFASNKKEFLIATKKRFFEHQKKNCERQIAREKVRFKHIKNLKIALKKH